MELNHDDTLAQPNNQRRACCFNTPDYRGAPAPHLCPTSCICSLCPFVPPKKTWNFTLAVTQCLCVALFHETNIEESLRSRVFLTSEPRGMHPLLIIADELRRPVPPGRAVFIPGVAVRHSLSASVHVNFSFFLLHFFRACCGICM